MGGSVVEGFVEKVNIEPKVKNSSACVRHEYTRH